MTALTRTAVRPFYAQLSIERLSQLVRLLAFAEKSAMALAVTTGVVIVLQLAYPSNRMLPLQRIGGHYVGFKTEQQVADTLRPYDQARITAEINNKRYTTTADKAGISLNTAGLAKDMMSYSWQQRLVPGSLLHKTELAKVPTVIDLQKQAVLAKTLASSADIAPKNASVSRLPDGTYKLQHQITGVAAKQDSLASALKALDPIVHKTTRVDTVKESPAITDTMLSTAIIQYDHMRKTPLNLSYNSTTYTISPAQITAWSSITTDENTKTATVTFDQQAIRNWLSTSVPLVVQQPGTSTVTIVNGNVQSRSNAAIGSGIDLDATVNSIVSALKDAHPSATAALKQISPKEQFIRQYTPTNEGLTALINDWQKDYPGLKAGVVLRELGGNNRQASLNGGTQYPTASIYKLFVDWYAYNQSEQGKLSLGSPSGIAGKNISQCIQASIITSDNPCGQWLGTALGWSVITAFAHAAGYGGTSLTSLMSTPADTANYMFSLAGGSLMNPADTQTMLSYMQSQIFRSGIPAGSAGAVVQDKVGINPGVWNDAAIVRGPRSSYVLVVYTNGNVNAIKDLASRIYSLMQT